MCVPLLIKQAVVTALLLPVLHVSSQDACERLTVDVLGNSSVLTKEGLLSEILTPGGDGSSQSTNVRILDMRVVCLAQHQMKDRYRYTSVIVSFECLTTDVRIPECLAGSPARIEQFDLGCVDGHWTTDILTVSDRARTTNPIADLTTELDTGCRFCINPNHPAAESFPVDSVTHCVGKCWLVTYLHNCTLVSTGCTNCTIGLQRCYNVQDDMNHPTEVCCNYFSGSEGACVNQCPDEFAYDTNFVCGELQT